MKRDQRELVSFLLHLRTDVPMVYLNQTIVRFIDKQKD